MTKISTRECVIWFLALLAFGIVADEARRLSFGVLVTTALNHNLIYILIYAAILSRALAIAPEARLSRGDAAVLGGGAVALALLSFVGILALDGAIAMALGLYLVRMRRAEENLRAIGAILLAFGTHLFVAKALQTAFQAEIVSVDSYLVEMMLRATGDFGARVGNQVEHASGFQVAIVGACSACNIVSLLIPAGVAAVMWGRSHFERSDLRWMIGGACALVVVNTLRLGLMVQSHEGYVYWHNEGGATWVAIVQTAVVLAVAAGAARPWDRPSGGAKVAA